jgi:hypothetical protein
MREHASLKDLLEKSRALETARKQLDDNRELVRRAMSRSRPWPTMKFRSSKNASPILNATFRSRWCRRIKRKSATRSSKSAPGQAATKPLSSPPIFAGCIIVMQKRRD